MGLKVDKRSHLSVSFNASSTAQGAILGLVVGWELLGEREFLGRFELLLRLLMMADPPFLKDWVTDSRSELGRTGGGGECGSIGWGGGSDQVFLSFGDRDFLLRGKVCFGNWSSFGVFRMLILADVFLDRLVLWYVTSLSSSWISEKA